MLVLSNQQVILNEAEAVVAKAQSILNSRPLTQNPDDPTDAEPLKPHHLLMLKSNQAMPPGSFSKQDPYSRCRWRQVQYLADVFWRRRLREYLLTLQKRHKWFSFCRDLKEERPPDQADFQTFHCSHEYRILEAICNKLPCFCSQVVC